MKKSKSVTQGAAVLELVHLGMTMEHHFFIFFSFTETSILSAESDLQTLSRLSRDGSRGRDIPFCADLSN